MGMVNLFFDNCFLICNIYIGCMVGSFDKIDFKLSSLVFNMVIFRRVVEKCRCVCGLVGGSVFVSEIMLFILLVSFEVLLYFRIYDLEGDVILVVS